MKIARTIIFLVLAVSLLMLWRYVVNNIDTKTQKETITKQEAMQKEEAKLEESLVKIDTVPGTGREATLGDEITVHYMGTLTDGQKFDSSYDRGAPYSFLLGAGKVIRGWDLGIVGMKVGGKRELTIPPGLAYGEGGAGGGAIPANATLKFVVELISIKGK